MDLEQAFAISASGLQAQKTRIDITSENIANVDTTRTSKGGPYRRKDVVFTAATPNSPFNNELTLNLRNNPMGVEVSKIVHDARPFKSVHEPGHPDADLDGYVLYPNVNVMEEMVNMLSALRAYEANVTAFNATKSMAIKTLEIGR